MTDKILSALLNGTNIKIILRARSAEDSEMWARALVPYNLERPIAALTRPTVVGHRRIQLANESSSTGTGRSKSSAKAIGWSVNASTTKGTAVTNGSSDSESSTESKAVILGDSYSKSTSESESESEGAVLEKPDDFFGITAPKTVSESVGSSSSTSESESYSSSEAYSYGTARSYGSQTSRSHTDSRSATRSRGKNGTSTNTDGTTESDGRSQGRAEGLEPILEDRPTSVHSLQNEIHFAAQAIRELPTGTGYVSYVGRDGPVATLFKVPKISPAPIDDDQFDEVLERLFEHIPSVDDVLRQVASRAELFVQPDEPKAKPIKRRPKPTMDDSAEPSSSW